MKEYQINEKRRWKAEVFPYDHFIPDDTQECQYCLTEKQAEILRGIIMPLAWKTRWWSETSSVDTDQIQAFTDDIVRRLMMSCCGDEGILFQYSDSGVLQESDDGGVTYHDVPEKDPRNNSPRFPPIAGSDGDDKKCVAATGMKDLIKQQVGDQLTDDMSRYTLNQLITDWVRTMIQSSNPFVALVTVIANQIFALVIATLRPALTSGVYDDLLCIFYNNMGNDASFTQAQVEQVRSDITSAIGGIAGVFLEHLVYLLGQVGLTNLARASGSVSGDCTGCNPCEGFDTSAWSNVYIGAVGVGDIDPATRTCNHVEITATQGVDGVYRAIFGTLNGDCAIGIGHNAVSGGYDTTRTCWNPCGTAATEIGNGYNQDNLVNTHCLNAVMFQANGPFVVAIDSISATPCT